jgi:uncharacterized protein (TIGR03000 family)
MSEKKARSPLAFYTAMAGIALGVLFLSPIALAQRGDSPTPRAPEGAAEITLLVPEGAEVFFDGKPTKQTGPQRVYYTPALETGKKFEYVVLVRWTKDGKPHEQKRTIPVASGDRIRIDFRTTSGTVENPNGTHKRVAVAKCLTPRGSMLRREGEGKPWQVVDENETLYTGDTILALPMSVLQSKDGAVHLTVRSDLSGTDPMPIFETVYVLHEPKDVSLDFTLERGRIELSNEKKTGEANVVAHIRDQMRTLTLTEPGTRVVLEIYSHWPPGVPFRKEQKPGEGPALMLAVIVLKGEVLSRCPDRTCRLTEPPGPALIVWDSIAGNDITPLKVEKLPEWAVDDGSSEKAKEKKARIERIRKMIATKPIGEALDELIASDDVNDRRVAVFAMGALDDLPRLAKVLQTSRREDVWDNGVLALRHWIGRAPGQDQKLIEGLRKNNTKMTEVQAETILQLLHSFGDNAISHPEWYETMIDYLDHHLLAMRGLAYWHLSRVVPEGRKFGYHPLDSKEQREKAIAEWRKLIPPGKLPPKATPEKKGD